jgi:hypothetical protein
MVPSWYVPQVYLPSHSVFLFWISSTMNSSIIFLISQTFFYISRNLIWFLFKESFSKAFFKAFVLSSYLKFYLFSFKTLFTLSYWGFELRGLHLLGRHFTSWATPPALLFCVEFFQDRVLQTICPGWFWTVILLMSTSKVARIIGEPFFFFFLQYCSLNSGPIPRVTLPTLFCDGFFQHRVSWTVCLGWLQTKILLILPPE